MDCIICVVFKDLGLLSYNLASQRVKRKGQNSSVPTRITHQGYLRPYACTPCTAIDQAGKIAKNVFLALLVRN